MRFNDVTRGTGLERHGITNANLIYWTAPTPVLYEQIVRRGEGLLTHLGAIAVKTGPHTELSPADRFIVEDPDMPGVLDWNPVATPFEPGRFDALYDRMLAYIHGKDLFVQDCFAGAAPSHQIPLRIITEKAWHSLFARNMFIQARPDQEEPPSPRFTLVDLPTFHAVPSLDGTRSEAFIIINFARGMIAIGGTAYAGEIRAAVSTVLQYLLPLGQAKVLPLHCAASIGPQGRPALFFGARTCPSAGQQRSLIGDEIHGWDEQGIFNLEGGGYTRILGLSRLGQPERYDTTRKFGTLLENVAIDTHTRRVDLANPAFTDNTRASYPLSHLRGMAAGCAGHPAVIVMGSCDPYGILPPIARLSADQALFHFLAGYAGEEADDSSEPRHSPCFGGPFLPLKPVVYGELFRRLIARHAPVCWLINTGWTGGPRGNGNRISDRHTCALLDLALEGRLDSQPFQQLAPLQLSIPTHCPGVPEELLDPRRCWPAASAYERAAQDFLARFRESFSRLTGLNPDLLTPAL